LVASFYAALNSSMWQRLPHQSALELLNDLCFPEHCPICAEERTSCPRFVCESFVSKTFASSMTPEEAFPWFDLTAAQLRESPFSQLLAGSEAMRSHLAALYRGVLGARPAEPRGLAGPSAALAPAPAAPDHSPSPSATPEISSKKRGEAAENESKSS
ncbi:NXRD1 protein, partial [Eudromia elegans]|nr:NXRD1 protein [Eudromia elegans]